VEVPAVPALPEGASDVRPMPGVVPPPLAPPVVPPVAPPVK